LELIGLIGFELVPVDRLIPFHIKVASLSLPGIIILILKLLKIILLISNNEVAFRCFFAFAVDEMRPLTKSDLLLFLLLLGLFLPQDQIAHLFYVFYGL
jgi:hypothetical protein